MVGLVSLTTNVMSHLRTNILRNKMKQHFFIFLLLVPTIVFSQIGNDNILKVKAKSDGNRIKIKMLIKNKMIGDRETWISRKNMKADFITHITAQIKNKLVFDISMSPLSPLMSSYPVIKYQIRDTEKANSIEYVITDINNKENKYSFPIKRKYNSINSSEQPKVFKKNHGINYRKVNPKVWEVANIQESIYELYGSVTSPIRGKINLLAPKDVDCTERVPINISTNIDLESFAILTDKMPYSTVAVISIPEDTIINYDFKIKVNPRCDTTRSIIVFGKDRDGKFYKTIMKNIKVPCADDCGGGG